MFPQKEKTKHYLLLMEPHGDMHNVTCWGGYLGIWAKTSQLLAITWDESDLLRGMKSDQEINKLGLLETHTHTAISRNLIENQ